MANEKIVSVDGFKIVLDLDKGGKVEHTWIESIRLGLNHARQRLPMVLGWGEGKKNDVDYRAAMNAYFRIPANMPAAEYDGKVRRLVGELSTLYENVKSPDITFQQVIVTGNTADAAAYVQRGLADVLHETVFGANPLTRANFYGPIFLRTSPADAITAAGNILHEATHRYLGARDWAYLPNFDMLFFEKSHRDLGIPLPQPPKSINALKAWYDLSPDEALNNADSMAGFLMYVTAS